MTTWKSKPSELFPDRFFVSHEKIGRFVLPPIGTKAEREKKQLIYMVAVKVFVMIRKASLLNLGQRLRIPRVWVFGGRLDS
ncbi:hypothetical protein M426DRAFT_179813 [Hypoxylon sp. CI-4A]|nr:hypothetical protein M426DRAFT_179813 [Hypoxylon sp. CI-4A]